MGFFQQFHLIIKYQKGNTNKLANMLSRPPTSKITTLGTLMHMDPFTHDAYKSQTQKVRSLKRCLSNCEAKFMWNKVTVRLTILQNGLLYNLDKPFVLKCEITQLIAKAHTSKFVGHFGVGKTIANLQRYVYWPRVQEDVTCFIRGCIFGCTDKLSNIEQGLCDPFLVPS